MRSSAMAAFATRARTTRPTIWINEAISDSATGSWRSRRRFADGHGCHPTQPGPGDRRAADCYTSRISGVGRERLPERLPDRLKQPQHVASGRHAAIADAAHDSTGVPFEVIHPSPRRLLRPALADSHPGTSSWHRSGFRRTRRTVCHHRTRRRIDLSAVGLPPTGAMATFSPAQPRLQARAEEALEVEQDQMWTSMINEQSARLAPSPASGHYLRSTTYGSTRVTLSGRDGSRTTTRGRSAAEPSARPTEASSTSAFRRTKSPPQSTKRFHDLTMPCKREDAQLNAAMT